MGVQQRIPQDAFVVCYEPLQLGSQPPIPVSPAPQVVDVRVGHVAGTNFRPLSMVQLVSQGSINGELHSTSLCL